MKKLLSAIAIGIASFGASATPVIIDNFDGLHNAEDTSIGAGGCASGVAAGTGCFDSLGGTMLGSERDIFTDLVSGTGSEIETILGRLNFSVDTLSTASGSVTWDGVDGSNAVATTGLGNADLTNGGVNTAFAFDVLFADAGFDFEINLWDGTSGLQVANASFVAAGTAVPVTRMIDFSDAQFAGVNFMDIGAVQFVFDPNAGFTSLDLSVDTLATVPEPAPLALLSLGLIGIGLSSYRKRKQ